MTGSPTLGATLLDADAISRRVAQLAAEIDAHYAGSERPVVLLCVLKGSLIFTADLARKLTIPVEIDVVAAQSYGSAAVSSGLVVLTREPLTPLQGRDVLIVEDILDTGATVDFLRRHLDAQHPRSLRLVTLLDKTSRRAHPIKADWSGFDIPDHFVVGYGLDHGEQFRNLADVRVLEGV